MTAAPALANVAVMASHGSRSDLFIWHRYYIPAYLSAAALAAVGLDFVLDLARRRGARLHRLVASAALAAALLLVPLRYREHDRSRYAVAEGYSRLLLASLPPGAHLAASADRANAATWCSRPSTPSAAHWARARVSMSSPDRRSQNCNTP